jgi:hypothetical protein
MTALSFVLLACLLALSSASESLFGEETDAATCKPDCRCVGEQPNPCGTFGSQCVATAESAHQQTACCNYWTDKSNTEHCSADPPPAGEPVSVAKVCHCSSASGTGHQTVACSKCSTDSVCQSCNDGYTFDKEYNTCCGKGTDGPGGGGGSGCTACVVVPILLVIAAAGTGFFWYTKYYRPSGAGSIGRAQQATYESI